MASLLSVVKILRNYRKKMTTQKMKTKKEKKELQVATPLVGEDAVYTHP